MTEKDPLAEATEGAREDEGFRRFDRRNHVNLWITLGSAILAITNVWDKFTTALDCWANDHYAH